MPEKKTPLDEEMGVSEPLKDAIERLIKGDVLTSLFKHGNAMWFGVHDEKKCHWCQKYKKGAVGEEFSK